MQERDLFIAALEKTPAERTAYLNAVCSGDHELRRKVEQLLIEHEKQQSFFLDTPFPGAQVTVTEPPPELVGLQIGPYKLLQQIGEGGMGTVFMAEQSHPVQRKVAIKVIKPGMDSSQVIARFEAERQALAIMDHVNIARVLDAGTTEQGRPYFVMELVHGVPITKYCDDNHLTPRERLELFIPVCQAIQHAHQKGIIHRDIKPSNVMVTLYDGKPVPKVIDFGVAKATEHKLTARTLFTQYGALVGTLEYMSPEQAEMSALGVDTRSDIYSLGVLLYELLTGSTPLSHERMKVAAYAEILRMIKEDDPPKPSTRLSELSDGLASISAQRKTEPTKLSKLMRGELDWIVMKTLEKDRNRRYETANGFAADLLRYLNDEAVEACPPSAAYRLRKFARRNRATLISGTIIVTALFVATVGLAISNVLVRSERNEKVQALNGKVKALSEKEEALRQAQANHQEAKRQEVLAKRNAEHAERQQQVAQKQESLARRRFYAAQMNLAMQAWEAGQPARMLELLESQRPRFDQEDLRGFDWYYLWQLCQGGYKFSLPTQNYDNASAVAISPDGKMIATGYGRTVRLWDASTGRQTAELAGHSNLVGWLSFAPDNKTLASSDQSDTVRIWDLTTGNHRAMVQTGEHIRGVQFIADGKQLVFGSKFVKIWDVVANHEVASLGEAQNENFERVAAAPDGAMIAAASGDEIRIWERDGQGWREHPPASGVGFYPPLAISPDGNLGSFGGTSVRLFELLNRKERATLRGQTGRMYAVAFSADSMRLVSGGQDRTVRVWDVATSQQRASIATPGPVYGLALTPDCDVVAAMGTDAIRVFNVAQAAPMEILPQAVAARLVVFSPDGKTFAFDGKDGVTLWSPDEKRQVAKLASIPKSNNRRGIAFSPDGKTVATSGLENRSIDLWNLSGHHLAVLNGAAYELAFSPNGKSLAATSGGSIAVWDVDSKQQKWLLPVSQEATCVAISPDGKTIAAGGQFGVVKLFDCESGRELAILQRFELAVDFAYSVAFSPHGRLLATGNRQGVVHIWNVSTNQLEVSLIGHTDAVRSLAFTDGGRTLATGSEDGTIRLWDVSTGQERITLKGHEKAVTSVAFAPGGNLLVSSGTDKTVRIWRAALHGNAHAPQTELNADDATSPVAYNELGDRLWESDRIGEAKVAYRKGIERLEKLRVAFPEDPAYRQELVRSLLSLSVLLRSEDKDNSGAEPLRVRAREIYRTLTLEGQKALFFAYEERRRKLSVSNDRQSDRTYSQLIELIPEDDIGWLIQASRHLVTCPDVKLRDSSRAVEIARKITAAAPGDRARWYNLGLVLFRSGDSPAAIKAFEKDEELSRRNDGWRACYLAMANWRLGRAEPARQWFYKSFLHTARDHRAQFHELQMEAATTLGLAELGERVGHAVNFHDQGDAFEREGKSAEAKAAYSNAIESYETVAAELPFLSTLTDRLVALMAKTGRKQETDRVYRRAIAALESLTEPQVDQRLLLGNYSNDLATLLRSRQELEEAERFAHKSVTVKTALATEFPRKPDLRFHLVHSHLGLGYILREQKRTPDAAKELGQADRLLKTLAADRGFRDHFREHVGHTCWQLADAWMEIDHFEDAVRSTTYALEYFQWLAADYPVHHFYRQELAFTHRRLADLAERMSRMDDVEGHLRTSADLYRMLWGEVPSSAFYPQEAAHVELRLGSVLQRAGKLAEADLAFAEAVRLRSNLAAAVAREYSEFALKQLNEGAFVAAKSASERAALMFGDLNARSPDDSEIKNQLAGALAYQGVTSEKLKLLELSRHSYEKAVTLWKELSDKVPDNEWYRQECAYFSLALARVLEDAGNPQTALEHSRTSVRLNEKLVVDFAGKPVHRERLANARSELIRLLLSQGAHLELKTELEALLREQPSAEILNNVAWRIVRHPGVPADHTALAREFAKQAVVLKPDAGHIWNTLAVAHYRTGDWKQTIAAHHKSMELRKGGDSVDWFFLAMAHWQLDEKDEARRWYRKALEWMEANAVNNSELQSFRAEAKKLITDL